MLFVVSVWSLCWHRRPDRNAQLHALSLAASLGCQRLTHGYDDQEQPNAGQQARLQSIYALEINADWSGGSSVSSN